MSYSLFKNTWGTGPETIKTIPIKCPQPWPRCHDKNINSWSCKTLRNGEKKCFPDQRFPGGSGSPTDPFRYPSMEECNSQCNTPSPSYNSFICRTNMNGEKKCFPDQRFPGGSGSPTDPFRYPSMEECNRACNLLPIPKRWSCIGSEGICIENDYGEYESQMECINACNGGSGSGSGSLYNNRRR